MPLKYTFESQDAIPKEFAELYRKGEDGKFYLDVEGGVVPKDRLNEFRTNNIQLMKKQDDITAQLEETLKKLRQYDGIDLEEVKTLKAQAQQLRDKKLIDAGKIDELITERISGMKVDFEKQLELEKSEKTKLKEQMENLLITEGLSKAAVAKGVRSVALADVLYRGREVFKVVDGKVSPWKDGKVVYGKDGSPLTMDAWLDTLVTDAPHLFEPSGGGNANNGSGGNANPKVLRSPSAVEFGKNLEEIAKGKVEVVLTS
jgi:hypothetical protein